jgi:adenosylmethionine-8-amino-7-oxononanoate aminotransferase
MVGIELVKDAATKQPFPRADRAAERLTQAARDRGLLVYPSTGCADGEEGDLIMLGPPLVITEAEIGEVVDRLVSAVGSL